MAKWIYVIMVAIIVGMVGAFITTLIDSLLRWKFTTGPPPPAIAQND